MNKAKTLLMFGAVLAMTATAGAAPVPFSHGWTGPAYMHIVDFSMGTLYDLGPEGQVNTWYPADDPNFVAVDSPATGAVDGESGWSIVRVDQIFEGVVLAPNTIGSTNEGNPLYDVGGFTGGKEVYGLIHSRDDLFVRINDDGTQQFMFQGDRVDLYVQDTGTYADATRAFLGLPADGSGDPATGIWGAAGSSGRLGGTTYVGIGYDEFGVAIPGALALVLDSEAGYFPAAGLNADPNYDAVEGRASFEPAIGIPSGSGDSDLFYSVIGGDQALRWDTNFFTPTRASGAEFMRADFRVHTTNAPVVPSGPFDWLLQSSDPVTAAVVVPEPITMIGAFLGISGIGAYIRKRR